jgi:hypothetical protein
MGINLTRNLANHDRDTLVISMQGYVHAGLSALNFVPSSKPNSPIVYTAPNYSGAIQETIVDTSPLVSPEDEHYLRSAVGIFRYYADHIDSTLSLSLSRLASQQEAPTENTMADLKRFLNYVAQFPDAKIVYRPSNMQLAIHSDESYCSEPMSRSRSAGFSTCGPIIYSGPDLPSSVNGPIRVSTTIIPTVVNSAMEASYAAMYLNALNATADRQTLSDLGHPQEPTIITYDNTAAGNMANKTAKVKRSKAIDMRYHWIQDRIEQSQFKVRWAPGHCNLADYPSKAHPIHHFKTLRPFFISLPKPTPLHSVSFREGVLI